MWAFLWLRVCVWGTIWLEQQQKESNSGSSSNNYNRRHTKDFNTNTHWQAYVWTKSGNITHTPRCTSEPLLLLLLLPRRLLLLLLPKQRPQRTEIKRKQTPFPTRFGQYVCEEKAEKAGEMGGEMPLRGTDKSLFTKIVLMQLGAMQHGL